MIINGTLIQSNETMRNDAKLPIRMMTNIPHVQAAIERLVNIPRTDGSLMKYTFDSNSNTQLFHM